MYQAPVLRVKGVRQAELGMKELKHRLLQGFGICNGEKMWVGMEKGGERVVVSYFMVTFKYSLTFALGVPVSQPMW